MEEILDIALEMGASDIHLSLGHHPFFRVKGKLTSNSRIDKISKNDIAKFKNYIVKNMYDLTSVDGSFSYNEHRFRYNICYGEDNPNISIRVIPMKVLDIDKLNLPMGLKNIMKLKTGLILVSGKTGSGKSTTLSSMIEEINNKECRKIIIIEDPIEYTYSKSKCLIIQRELNKDISYDEDIKKTLVRQDPDIIVIGEIRDNNSIKLCVELAELGHLVIASIHANSIIDTISRLVEVFPNDDKNYIRYRLSLVLQCIINQDLICLGDKQMPICELLILEEASRSMIRENKNASMINDRIYTLNKINGSETKIQNISNLLNKKLIKESDLNVLYNEDDIEKIRKLSYNRNINNK